MEKSIPQRTQAGRAVSLPSERGSPSSPESRHLGDRNRRHGDGSSPGSSWLADTRLSVFGPAGGGGGHEADAGTAAATAPTAAAEAALGGQLAGDAGGARPTGLPHEHRASTGACAQQVPTTHDDLGPTQAGAADATRTDAAAGVADSATGEGGTGDQGLGPAHQATAGAAHGCRRKKRSARLPCPSRSLCGVGDQGWWHQGKGLGGGGPYCLHSQYPLSLLLSG